MLTTSKTRTGRLWSYLWNDRPFAGPAPPAAIYFYSPDRTAARPEAHLAHWLMQADAHSGFNRLYAAGRRPGPIVEVACWAYARCYFFDLARPDLPSGRGRRRLLAGAGFALMAVPGVVTLASAGGTGHR
jgi:transposase